MSNLPSFTSHAKLSRHLNCFMTKSWKILSPPELMRISLIDWYRYSVFEELAMPDCCVCLQNDSSAHLSSFQYFLITMSCRFNGVLVDQFFMADFSVKSFALFMWRSKLAHRSVLIIHSMYVDVIPPSPPHVEASRVYRSPTK